MHGRNLIKGQLCPSTFLSVPLNKEKLLPSPSNSLDNAFLQTPRLSRHCHGLGQQRRCLRDPSAQEPSPYYRRRMHCEQQQLDVLRLQLYFERLGSPRTPALPTRPEH